MSSGLSAESISVDRAGRKILCGVSCRVQPGRVTAVLGANGAGKSTLLAAMSGELSCQKGVIHLDGLSLEARGVAEQARRRAVLPQQVAMGFPLAVSKVVEMGLYPFPELTPEEVARDVGEALGIVGLRNAAQRPYDTLSGGEQQRVQFARVWAQVAAAVRCQGQAYLLMDEPVSNLDPRHQLALLHSARRAADTSQVGVLVVLHDLNLAAQWCDELLLLAAGQVLVDGTPEQVLTPEALEQAYGLRPSVVPHPVKENAVLVLFH
ncbi:heme ABC transporter ATP-binding protein [Pusillimonas sp. CC-YST705]|uniref:Heme ABC transporter ATP-binding protein n=1 Tax=Mesopusillimonas faecipullorum TaxID=2755040 RepID=A0ABS8CBG3_9BURK|nr:heme ABC transporter ATP-binding protein [Mesopusillimonas faecipullorum]MCB5363328.1 heme ABC transporter ATP-binding protein [Mesopusillimonas faecipullorum]